MRAGALALLALGGCGSTSEPATGDIAKDLKHADPRFRIEAARAAVQAERRDLAPLLIETLGDEDPAVRMWASVALRKLTGQDFDFKPHGTPAEREESVRRWLEWARSAVASDPRPKDG